MSPEIRSKLLHGVKMHNELNKRQVSRAKLDALIIREAIDMSMKQ